MQIIQKLENISKLLQRQIRETNNSYKEAELIANQLGYTFSKESGKLSKQ